MRVVTDTPRQPGWMDSHLNWTVVIAEIAVNIVLAIIISLLFIVAFTIDFLSTGEVEESLLWVLMLVNVIVHLAIILPIAGWALKKKARSLWWLLILFVPVAGWVVYLCLRNRRAETEAVPEAVAGAIT